VTPPDRQHHRLARDRIGHDPAFPNRQHAGGRAVEIGHGDHPPAPQPLQLRHLDMRQASRLTMAARVMRIMGATAPCANWSRTDRRAQAAGRHERQTFWEGRPHHLHAHGLSLR